MSSSETAWAETVSPALRRPPLLQMAGLCYRVGKKGPQILLVTSSAGNWIMPKGWPIPGLSGAKTALQEAWEEGGVRGKVSKKPHAVIDSEKRFKSGKVMPSTVEIYLIDVSKLANRFPEQSSRKRGWFTPGQAAQRVKCRQMKKVLRKFDPDKL